MCTSTWTFACRNCSKRIVTCGKQLKSRMEWSSSKQSSSKLSKPLWCQSRAIQIMKVHSLQFRIACWGSKVTHLSALRVQGRMLVALNATLTTITFLSSSTMRTWLCLSLYKHSRTIGHYSTTPAIWSICLNSSCWPQVPLKRLSRSKARLKQHRVWVSSRSSFTNLSDKVTVEAGRFNSKMPLALWLNVSSF